MTFDKDYIFYTLKYKYLMVDDEWIEDEENGFSWWPYKFAQRVRILKEETEPESGMTGFTVSICTDFLKNVELQDDTRIELLFAETLAYLDMSGPVYDEDKKTLSFCSAVTIYEDTAPMFLMMLGVAAAFQLDHVHKMAPYLKSLLQAESWHTPHPMQGIRKEPSDMIHAVDAGILPVCTGPIKFTEEDFKNVFDHDICCKTPSVLATQDDYKITVEFPFGEETSLCRIFIENDTRYGKGLMLQQLFPMEADIDIPSLALQMNKQELASYPWGYGFGTYYIGETPNTLGFRCFFPNIFESEVFLSNIYKSCIERAHELSSRFTGNDWSHEDFSSEKSGISRLISFFEGLEKKIKT